MLALRGKFLLSYYRSWYIYRNAMVKSASYFFLIKATHHLSVFTVLIIFNSLDVFVYIVPYCKRAIAKGIERKPLIVFVVFLAAFLVCVFWNITVVSSKLRRQL